jgi:hypothetical protein
MGALFRPCYLIGKCSSPFTGLADFQKMKVSPQELAGMDRPV